MSRLEQRNLVILVAVIVGLLVGAGVLANYTGILQAEAKQQSQSKSSCTLNKTECPVADKEASGVSAAFASAETAEAAGSCPADKIAGCEHDHASGCCAKRAGCNKEAGCGEAASSSCSGTPKAEGCRVADSEGAI